MTTTPTLPEAPTLSDLKAFIQSESARASGPYALTDDGLAYMMDDAQKVYFLDHITQELNKMPQSGNYQVVESLIALQDRIFQVLTGVTQWRLSQEARRS